MKKHVTTLCLALLACTLFGCATTPETEKKRTKMSSDVNKTITLMRQRDPSMERFFRDSYGYAVMPSVFRTAWVLGDAHATGEVYEQGRLVGYTRMTALTIGFSFGGEFFREIIFFQAKDDLDKFKKGEYSLAAHVKGVALTAGVGGKTNYRNGLAVFIMTDFGAMVDASVGGQKFKYERLKSYYEK